MDDPEEWRTVCLPHTPFVADLDGQDHWQGLCAYRRRVRIEVPPPNCLFKLHFGAAMHSAKVFIDDTLLGEHDGGYLPFELDATEWLRDGQEHELRVELDNRENADVPPGKPYQDLDFCYYGGLYRHVELRTYPEVHITDPVAAREPGSGGIFVRTDKADAAEARLALSAHIRNASDRDRLLRLRYRILSRNGPPVASGISDQVALERGAAATVPFTVVVAHPQLWSLAHPNLHYAEITVVEADGAVLDCVRERFGIRRLSISRSGGIALNGERTRPLGVNRHQDYPLVGYALSDAAQYRDAKRIKESGFDYVRLSHYPQSPAFLDACDELGILVMNCIPGWQFLGGEAFRQACYQNARDLVRRDRNHPCVILWELSLNETEMDQDFMDTLMRIGHEEYPGDQMHVCGWMDHFDVFIHSRQHGQIHSWKNGDKALVVAEYGDWEFYAANEGFDQKTGAGLLDDWSNSRAFRGAGEHRLRQQALNHIVALTDTLSSPAVCDGLWSMYDYPRGYHPTRAACGAMDFYRLPKYSYFFYRSQRPPSEGGPGWSGGPMVYVASRWFGNSHLDALVFSNCERVELRLNGAPVGDPSPLQAANARLPFPPLVFELKQFEPGRLEATGFLGGEAVARHWVATPGSPATLTLSIDDDGCAESLAALDVLFAHARIVDELGVLCKDSSLEIRFELEAGDAELVGPVRIAAESGVASIVVRRLPGCRSFTLRAWSERLGSAHQTYRVAAEAGERTESACAAETP